MIEKDVYNELEQLSVNLEHLRHMAEFAREMVAALASSNVKDNPDKRTLYEDRVWALAVGMSDSIKARESELDGILKKADIIND